MKNLLALLIFLAFTTSVFAQSAGPQVGTNTTLGTLFGSAYTTSGTGSVISLTASPTFTGTLNAAAIADTSETITGAVNTTSLNIIGNTDTSATKEVSISTTWNNSGTTFDAPIYLSVINTASNVSSNLMDLRSGVAGTTSVFAIQQGGNITSAGNVQVKTGICFCNTSHVQLNASGSGIYIWGTGDSATPQGQTFNVENVIAGTTNTAGVAETFSGSKGTGTGLGGALIFQTAPAGTTGSSQNVEVTALTVASGGGLQLTGAAPTASSGSVGTGSTTNKGQVTGLSAATSLTVTFNVGSPLAASSPACVPTGSVPIVSPSISAISSTAVTFTMTAFTGTLYYVCF